MAVPTVEAAATMVKAGAGMVVETAMAGALVAEETEVDDVSVDEAAAVGVVVEAVATATAVAMVTAAAEMVAKAWVEVLKVADSMLAAGLKAKEADATMHGALMHELLVMNAVLALA